MPRERNDNAVSLHVSGFKDNTRPSDLASLFEPHGRIADVYIPKDYYSGLPRGFAYIQYQDEEDARRVFESGEQFSLDGRKLDIQYAQGRRKTPNQMRGNIGLTCVTVTIDKGDAENAAALDRLIATVPAGASRVRARALVRLAVVVVTAGAQSVVGGLVREHHPAVVLPRRDAAARHRQSDVVLAPALHVDAASPGIATVARLRARALPPLVEAVEADGNLPALSGREDLDRRLATVVADMMRGCLLRLIRVRSKERSQNSASWESTKKESALILPYV
ncbi:Arginine/serine-rich splicing factor scl25a transcript I [Dissophora globulifera]|uniref:Arginine/serine-rich splicing factor scl25a transcript I n=1 Tax=Dissophora globulifera TaxID=979702 RepID=A0A9P6R7H7_9FUNG|nr:Arginine/serine-rich splicing factor scl25a transcript I [Dissophora globulifera]